MYIDPTLLRVTRELSPGNRAGQVHGVEVKAIDSLVEHSPARLYGQVHAVALHRCFVAGNGRQVAAKVRRDLGLAPSGELLEGLVGLDGKVAREDGESDAWVAQMDSKTR